MKKDIYEVHISKKTVFKTDDVFTFFYKGDELIYVRIANNHVDAYIPTTIIKKIVKNGEVIWGKK